MAVSDTGDREVPQIRGRPNNSLENRPPERHFLRAGLHPRAGFENAAQFGRYASVGRHI